MAFVPLILVMITLTSLGYMAYMAYLVMTMCRHAERQDKKWNSVLERNK
jgi:hypothetical protein